MQLFVAVIQRRENCVVRMFMLCTFHKKNQVKEGRRGVHITRMRMVKNNTMFQFGCQKGRYYFGDVDIAGRVLLQLSVGNED
jgi:hypothetical protein